MLHPFDVQRVARIELPELFTNPFDYAPHPLVDVARDLLCDYLNGAKKWHEEIEQGKMFGVLVVESRAGELGFLAAFSGYLAKQTLHEYFVPPIVNLLETNGFFAVGETQISQINRRVEQLDSSDELAKARAMVAQLQQQECSELTKLRAEYAAARELRRAMRLEGCSEAELTELGAESQRQKGVIKRRELYYRELISAEQQVVDRFMRERSELVEERQSRSAALQREIFSNFKPLNGLGAPKDLISIFDQYNKTIPPAGSGECAAPKLLHYAFKNGLRPIAMGEFWWGRSTRGEVRRHMHYYPACRGKCHPILSYMLQGLCVEPPHTPPSEQTLEQQLEVIFEDDYMVAFNKPSGLPSVKGLNHTISVQSIAEQRYADVNPNNLIVHRLDMDTSGVLIVAKSAEVQSNLQQQFAAHTIRKRYIALLEGQLTEASGAIDLPLSMDPLDRPRQRVDFNCGKESYTHYSLMAIEGSRSRVALYPQTGRTHQLRVHCAHHQGLNTPIVGDRLYGSPAERLMLHAEQITLQHPATGRKFTLRCNPSF